MIGGGAQIPLGGTWRPSSHPGLVGWFSLFGADAAVTVDGTPNVTALRNMVGADSFVPAPSPLNPPYQATGWNSNRPQAAFSNHQLRDTASVIKDLPVGIDAPLTFCVTFEITAGAGLKFLLQWTDDATSYLALHFDDQIPVWDVNGGGNFFSSIVVSGRATLMVSSGGGTVDFWCNGSYVDGGAVTTNCSTNSRLTLGANTVGVNPFKGSLCEMLFYNQKHGLDLAQRYHQYAKNKWGGLP